MPALGTGSSDQLIGWLLGLSSFRDRGAPLRERQVQILKAISGKKGTSDDFWGSYSSSCPGLGVEGRSLPRL